MLLLALIVGSAAPRGLEAQYFGRNKVHYESFDFKTLKTPHFDVYFYPAESLAAADAARMAERWYTRLSGVLRHNPGRKPLIFYADHPDFQQTNVIGGFISQGTGGVTESVRNRVIMPFTGVYADNDHVLGHEIVHAFQYDMADSAASVGQRGGGLNALPLWLIEGMAEYLSLGRNDPNTAMWLRDAALRNDLPTVKQLTNDPRYFPYRYGQAFWAYVGGKWGDDKVTALYRQAVSLGWEPALQRVLGRSDDSLSKEWLATIRQTYGPLIEGRTKPADAGQLILGTPGVDGEMNVSPTISPDGRYVAFLARREVFTIDLFVADATTGKVVKQLTGPNRDQHFDALSFIASAGSWSPDGQKLAFVLFAKGRNELAIFDVSSGDIERRIRAPGVGAISDPAWSPDGQRIVFSGSSGGIGDLYSVELSTSAVTRLTNDRFAELHPAWSPDGRTIAFATDRGPATNFARLEFGSMRLAVMDASTREVQVLPGFEGAKHINPQFSPDGRDLFFISDREGFSDIYRLSLASGELRQVTRLATGVSGITRLSPALTVARQTGRVLFSVFTEAGNRIHALDANQMAGAPVAATGTSVAGLLPPPDAAVGSVVERYLADVEGGLPPEGTRYAVGDAKGGLQLEYLGAPYVGVGVNQLGRTGLSGAVAAYFGDMLANQTLGAAIQAQGTIKDVGGEVFYLNAKNRVNWLLGASHVPYLTGFATIFDTTVTVSGSGDVPSRVVRQQLQRTFIDRASTAFMFPFSQTRRFELGAGYTFVNYDVELDEQFFLPGGSVIERVRGADAPPGVNYGEASLAFVGDYSHFGFTSPAAGGRYRFEVTPIFGGLNMQTLLGDYRRYFLARPFTFAFRGLYFGRYGKDAESTRLSPLFLGEETLIRGYAFESFDPAECSEVQGDNTACPEFDRLVGSRLGVFNAEFRIPLFGVRDYGVFTTRFLPVEIAPFFDMGVAWRKGVSTDLTFTRNSLERVPVFSTGLSVRANLFGFAVLETYYAYPFQRSEKGWHFGFNLAPGW